MYPKKLYFLDGPLKGQTHPYPGGRDPGRRVIFASILGVDGRKRVYAYVFETLYTYGIVAYMKCASLEIQLT